MVSDMIYAVFRSLWILKLELRDSTFIYKWACRHYYNGWEVVRLTFIKTLSSISAYWLTVKSCHQLTDRPICGTEASAPARAWTAARAQCHLKINKSCLGALPWMPFFLRWQPHKWHYSSPHIKFLCCDGLSACKVTESLVLLSTLIFQLKAA